MYRLALVWLLRVMGVISLALALPALVQITSGELPYLGDGVPAITTAMANLLAAPLLMIAAAEVLAISIEKNP